MQIKQKTIEVIKYFSFGNYLFYLIKKLLGKEPRVEKDFPMLISIEISSICNLACIHCPPHIKSFSNSIRKHSHIDFKLFENIMNEIDKFGKRSIALHKDGEPLIHPQIKDILERVKKNIPHTVYLTTNAQKLNEEISISLLKNKIDVINFSIGAASSEFYKKVRGQNFEKVLNNIFRFIELVSKSDWKPRIIVQIIDLPEFPEMQHEIDSFKKYWNNYNVEISVWKKLTWGVLEGETEFKYRYPCFSLWHSFNINSNGIVTACCMDWKQELIVGNIYNKSIKDIWQDLPINDLRRRHVEGKENTIPACKTCNYWKWQPMLMNYF